MFNAIAVNNTTTVSIDSIFAQAIDKAPNEVKFVIESFVSII